MLARAGEPTAVEAMADFALRVRPADLSPKSRQLLKRNVLDALGCAIGAIDGPPLRGIRGVVEALGGTASYATSILWTTLRHPPKSATRRTTSRRFSRLPSTRIVAVKNCSLRLQSPTRYNAHKR